MLSGIVSGLIIGGVISFFGVDRMLIEVVQPFIPQIELTTSHYYILFALIGLVGGFISDVFRN